MIRHVFHVLARTMLAGVFLSASPLIAATLQRADGSEIAYHLLDQTDEDSQGIILMLQGSGCEPVIERSWLKSEPSVIAPGRAVLAIEKYGVNIAGEGASDPDDGCPSEYWQGNTLHQRVSDANQVIAHMRKEPWWNGELIIYGGSEGGAVAAMLAPLIPETRAVIVVSSGIGVPVWKLIQSAVPPFVAVQIPDIIAEAAANPAPGKRFGGESYKWWADAANMVPARLLQQTDVPVLLVHGTRDQFAPVDTARATDEIFRQAGKTNLTYLELEGYDHFMVDEAGIDHEPEVMLLIASWLRSQPAIQ
ncbi:MAG: alpha/beta hydrolase [Sphingomonadaceae bacterium]